MKRRTRSLKLLRSTRECGSCTACCAVMAVTELDKPAGFRCHLLAAEGCADYHARPESCREYDCLWLTEAVPNNRRNLIRVDGAAPLLLTDAHRPDRSGVHMYLDRIDGRAVAVATEVWPGAFQSQLGGATLSRVAEKTVVALAGGGWRIVRLIGPRARVWAARSLIRRG